MGCNPCSCKESVSCVTEHKKKACTLSVTASGTTPENLMVVFWALLFCGPTAHPLPHRWSSQVCRAPSAEASLHVLTLYHPCNGCSN